MLASFRAGTAVPREQSRKELFALGEQVEGMPQVISRDWHRTPVRRDQEIGLEIEQQLEAFLVSRVAAKKAASF